MDILFLHVIFIVFISETYGDNDFFTVFRIGRSKSSLEVQTELHRLSNSIGLPLRTRNGFFIDSVQDMPSMKCTPAIEGCHWTMSSNWIYSPVNISHDEHLSVNIDNTFNLHGLYETCNDFNGGCEFMCSIDGRKRCSCPFGASTSQDESCYFDRKVTRGGHYDINIGYDEGRVYIIPPINTTTVIQRTDGKHSYLRMYEMSREGLQTNYQLDPFGRKILEKDKFFQVLNDYGGYRDYGLNIDMRRDHLTLNGEHGTLKYELETLTDSLCISVIYKTLSNFGNVNLLVSLGNGSNIEPNNIVERKREEWLQKRFYVSVGQPNTPVYLNLEVNGKGTIIYSVNGCSPYGTQELTVTKLLDSVPEKVYSSQPSQNYETSSCLNGGQLDTKTMECICPAGFTGRKCEEGCGPNSYGNDCSAKCSFYDWGCSGMIFCKRHLPCLCAPGYSGNNCDMGCEAGKYGANCTQECGQCYGKPCDVYTGVCHDGCVSGFHPPFCVKPYKYLETAPIISHEHFNSIRICFNISTTKGEGDITYYQIQYMAREALEKKWIETWYKSIEDQDKSDEEIICDNVTGLIHGHKYSARVVLIGADGGSYQDELVPHSNFTTLCSVPRSTEYKINHTSTSSSFSVRWQYETNYFDCSIKNYTVIVKRRWQEMQTITNQAHITFKNLIPHTEYKVKVKANTEIGNAPFSSWYTIKTHIYAPWYVSKLTVKPNGKKKLLVSWSPPKGSEDSLDKYIIKYKCMQYLACDEPLPEDEENEMELTIEASKTSVLLVDLNSHAVYTIQVAGKVQDFLGPFSMIRGATAAAEPDVEPAMRDNPVLSSTNTSAIVQWDPPVECNLFNGFFSGYRYELLFPNETLLREGYTGFTNVTFEDLHPQSKYTVNVYLVSSGGVNRDTKLTFEVTTKATVPSQVRNLTVYKRGRRLIGLRWKDPENTYGVISSFSVTHCQINGECINAITTRTNPTTCSAWRDHYCYTINNNLHPNKLYSITVKARNKEVNEDGVPVTITSKTSEGVPETPVELEIVNQTTQSVTIQWKPPSMFNGILRSFLVNVEHTDSANISNCCAYFPLHEIPVTEEKQNYMHEVNGLSPAAKYVIGISAKTLSIGLSSTLTINTPPEIPEYNAPKTLDDQNILIPTQDDFVGVTSMYLLIVIPENGNADSKIFDANIKEKLEELITENFFVAGEFLNEELPVTVSLGSDIDSRKGTLAVIQNADTPEQFRVGLALVLDYNGVKNVGFITADETPITI